MLSFKVSLRISSTHYTLEELKNELGEPDRSFSLGDKYSKGRNERKFTLWSITSSVSASDSLESHLLDIIDFLDGRISCFNKIKDKCDVDLFCMFSSDNGQGGAELTTKIIKKLSSYGLGLVFDIYTGED